MDPKHRHPYSEDPGPSIQLIVKAQKLALGRRLRARPGDLGVFARLFGLGFTCSRKDLTFYGSLSWIRYIVP